MNTLSDILEEAIATGYRVLVELDEEEPNMEKIQELYRKRASIIDKLDLFSDTDFENLDEDKTESIKSLFTRLELLEKELNKKLFILSESKQKALRQMKSHRQATGSYSKAAQSYEKQKAQIVDIVDNR